MTHEFNFTTNCCMYNTYIDNKYSLYRKNRHLIKNIPSKSFYNENSIFQWNLYSDKRHIIIANIFNTDFVTISVYNWKFSRLTDPAIWTTEPLVWLLVMKLPTVSMIRAVREMEKVSNALYSLNYTIGPSRFRYIIYYHISKYYHLRLG